MHLGLVDRLFCSGAFPFPHIKKKGDKMLQRFETSEVGRDTIQRKK